MQNQPINHNTDSHFDFKNSNRLIIIPLLVLLFIFSLAIRLHHLDYESLWMDELVQVHFYSNPFRQIIIDAASQAQPPVDYIIGRLFYYFHNSDFSVRLPAAIWGAGSVVVLVLLAARLCSWPLSFISGFIYALLPFNLYYSQEARPYAIATFFFLCVLWALDRLIKEKKSTRLNAIACFGLTLLFLHTRALAPAVIVSVCIMVLSVWAVLLIRKEGFLQSERQRSLIYAFSLMGLALVLYIPNFLFILSISKRYLFESSAGLHINTLINGIANFNVFPVWRAYVVQTEPLTYPLLIMIVLSPFLGWQIRSRNESSLWLLCTFLLPLTSCLHIFVFQAKSGMPFRPPYAFYILPLTFLIASIMMQGMRSLGHKLPKTRIAATAIFIFVAAFLLYNAAISASAFKSTTRKTAWRQTSKYLADNFNAKNALIFDSLSPYQTWEPNSDGFMRYYKGNSPITSVKQIPLMPPKVKKFSHEPVLILFQWREIFLTSKSEYPLTNLPSQHMKPINYQKIGDDPVLQVANFTGFSLIRLKEPTYDFIKDSYTIIERLLSHLPQDSTIVELYLAAAALAYRKGNKKWHDHIESAEKLCNPENLKEVRKVIENIKKSK